MQAAIFSDEVYTVLIYSGPVQAVLGYVWMAGILFLAPVFDITWLSRFSIPPMQAMHIIAEPRHHITLYGLPIRSAFRLSFDLQF
ncbi:hypothetical protein GALMADRAFT_228206 [Galerina marginata CBS 339.88]|uniref:Uncharacterized protein n=1 Tax=Galerina marginata (strain CBS 339.88) TaxID=685588 RepID=A0A067SUM9_GALM3|nr:hypothetical protein GALMADRAFT_228206 [Galerina marginata CBS 339.88]